MRRLLAIAALLGLAILFPDPVHSQEPVVTSPKQVTSANPSGSIAVSNTFQTVFAAAGTAATPAAAPRNGCLIQNNGANDMLVFFGPKASATAAKSFVIQPPSSGQQGGSIGCATLGGGVLQDEVNITGTSGDAYTANSQ